MIIDLIMDRKDGQPYNAREFYNDVMQYAETWPELANPITRAMDEGDENDVRRELCAYIDGQDYNPAIKDYINSVQWLESKTKEKASQEHTTGYVVNYRCCYGSCFVLKMSSRRLWHASGLERAKIYTTRAAAEKAAQRINQCYETIKGTAVIQAVEKGEYGWQFAA